MKITIPSVGLQPYIKQYWAIDDAVYAPKEHIQRVIPNGLPELTFYLGNRPISDKRSIAGNTLLNGQHTDYYDLILTGNISIFSISFQPDGLSHFLTIPIHELQNQTIHIKDIDKAFANRLEDQLWEASNFHERVTIVESYFLKRLSGHVNSVDEDRMRSAIALIKFAKGNVSIDLLADNACLSRKQFERKFLSHIGISPKQLMKIVRFQNAIHIRQQHPEMSLTAIAIDAGYYDQSHFINEVKSLSGDSPKMLLGRTPIIADFFLAQ